MKIKVGAFEYNTEAESQLAIDEQAKIAKLEEKMDYDNPKLVYSLYCKLVDKRVFKSPEGFLYLLHLQDYLNQNEDALPAPVPVIPADMFQKTVTKEVVRTVEVEVPATQEVKVASDTENATDSSDNENQAEIETDTENNTLDDEYDDEELQADIKRLQQRNLDDLMKKYKRTVTKNTKLRELLMFQRIAIFLLIVIVIVMLAIARNSSSPTILNYREKIQNEYAEWEQQLTDREKAVKEREKAIDVKTSDEQVSSNDLDEESVQ